MQLLLAEYCANEKGVQQAGTLLADIEDLQLATDVLEATHPVKWPARALAQLTLKVIKNIVFPYDSEDGGNDSGIAM